MDSLGRASGSIELRADGALRALDQVGRGLQNLDRQSQGFGTGFANSIQRNEQALNTLGTGFTAVGAGILGTFGLMTNTAANFEQSMDGVAASLGGIGTEAGVTEAQFKALSDEALRVGSTTSKSATEAAQAMDLMAKAGIEVETIVNGGAQAVVNLSEATNESLAQSASSMSSLFLLFEDTGISVTQMSDSIVTAMNNSDASLSEFQTGLARLAPVIKGGSLSFNEASAAIAYFNQQGFSAAETGTSLTSIFQSVSDPTNEMAAALEAAGIQAFDLNGNFVGFPALFDQVAAATAGMTEEQKANFLSTAFMTDGVDLLAAATSNAGDELTELEGKIGASGAAAEASATRMDNLKGDIEQLGGAFETLSIRVGSFALPALREVAQAVTAMVSAIANLPTPILGAIGAIGALVGVVSLVAGGILLALPRIALMVLAVDDLARSGGRLGAFAARLQGVLGFIVRMVPVVRAFTIAAALLGAAWKLNLFGIGDAISQFIASFSAIGGLTNPVSRFLSSLAAGLKKINIGPVQDFAETLFDLSDMVEEFVDGFTDAWDDFTGAIEDVAEPIDTIEEGLGDLGDSLTVVNGGVSRTTDLFGSLQSAVGATAAPVTRLAAFLMAVADGLRAINGDNTPAWLVSLATALDTVAGVVDDLTLAFQRFRDGGLNPVSAALQAVGAVFPVLNTLMDSLTGTVESLVGAFQAFAAGDWSGGFELLGSAARQAWDAIREGIGLLGEVAVAFADWAVSVGIPAVVGVAQDIWNAVSDWAVNTAWPAVRDTAINLGSAAVSIADWAIEQAVSLRTRAITFITGTAIPAAMTYVAVIPVIAAPIADWLVSEATSLYERVVTYVTGTAIPAVMAWVASIPKVAASILDWSVDSANEDTLATRIRDAIGNLAVDGIVALLSFATQFDSIDSASVMATLTAAKAAVIGMALEIADVALKVAFAASFGAVAGLGVVLFAATAAVLSYFAGNPLKAMSLAVAIEATFDKIGSSVAFDIAEIELFILDFLGVVPGAPLLLDIPTAFSVIWDGIVENIPSAGDITKAILAAIIPGGSLLVNIPVTFEFGGAEGPEGALDDAGGALGGGAWNASDPPKYGPGNSGGARFSGEDFLPNFGGGNPLAGLKAQIETGLAEITTTFQTKTAEWGTALATGMQPLGSIAGTHTGTMRAVSDANFLGMRLGGTTNVLQLGASVLGSIAGTAAGWGANLASMLGSSVSNFTSIRATGISNAATMGASVAASVATMASQGGASFGSLASRAIGEMSRMRGGSIGEAASAAAGIANTLASGAANAVNRFGGQIGRLAGVVSSAGGAAIGAAASLGSNVGATLANALDGMFGRVSAAASRLAGAAASAMAAALQVSSPSKWAIWLIEMLGKGLQIGFDRIMTPTIRAATGLSNALTGSMTPNASVGISPYASTVPAYAMTPYGGGSVVNHYTNTVSIGDIYQQPGEDSEMLRDRIIGDLHRELQAAGRR